MNTNNGKIKETFASKKQQDNDSTAKACFDFSGGPIRHVSFDCPENLKIALKETAKAQGQSVCSVLQLLSQAYVIASQACFSNTIKPHVTIDNLVLQRVVQRHRRVYHEREYTDVVEDVVEIGKPGVCHDCETKYGVYPRITVSNERVFLCGTCAARWVAERRIEAVRG